MTECVASLLSLWNGLFGLFRSLYRSRFHPSKRSGIHKEHFMWSLIGVVHWDSFQCPVFCNRCRNWCVLWSVFSLFALSMGILYLKLRRGTDLSNKFRPHTTFHHRRRKKTKQLSGFFGNVSKNPPALWDVTFGGNGSNGFLLQRGWQLGFVSLEVSKYPGNLQPSFLGVITHIWGVLNLHFSWFWGPRLVVSKWNILGWNHPLILTFYESTSRTSRQIKSHIEPSHHGWSTFPPPLKHRPC